MMAVAPRFARKSDPAGRSLVLPAESTAVIRYTRREDRDALLAFHQSISDTTVYMRYFSSVPFAWRTGAKRIADDLSNDPDHQLTLIIDRCAPGSGVLFENRRMLQLCREHGFQVVSKAVGGPVEIALDLCS